MFDLPGKEQSFPGKLEEVERRTLYFATIYISFDFQLVLENAMQRRAYHPLATVRCTTGTRLTPPTMLVRKASALPAGVCPGSVPVVEPAA